VHNKWGRRLKRHQEKHREHFEAIARQIVEDKKANVDLGSVTLAVSLRRRRRWLEIRNLDGSLRSSMNLGGRRGQELVSTVADYLIYEAAGIPGVQVISPSRSDEGRDRAVIAEASHRGGRNALAVRIGISVLGAGASVWSLVIVGRSETGVRTSLTGWLLLYGFTLAAYPVYLLFVRGFRRSMTIGVLLGLATAWWIWQGLGPLQHIDDGLEALYPVLGGFAGIVIVVMGLASQVPRDSEAG
jgi:hypothetical protein